MQKVTLWVLGCVLGVSLAACAAEELAPRDAGGEGARLSVNIAALNLPGVGDVVWDLEVDNGLGQVVWQRRLSSSGFGDGAGSASYIGPCDADPAANTNTVKVWVVGVYAAPVSAMGSFNTGSTAGAGAVSGPALPFENPTTASAPLTRTVVCQENADLPVNFDVTLMRPAEQGFFDIAVNFNNIFCSAKFDCCDDADDDGTCDAGEELDLLFNATGNRARSMVLGFACTAGTSTTVNTTLLMDKLAFDCTAPGSGFSADFTIDPGNATIGNQCTPGDLGNCTIVDEPSAPAVRADDYLYQVAIYRGDELLPNDGAPAHKAYWNVALGVTDNISACTLRTRASAEDSNNAGDGVVDGVVAAGTVYPYIDWEVPLGSCASEPLSFGGTGMVQTRYSETNATSDAAFDYAFAPGLPPSPICADPCVHGACTAPDTCTCDSGWTGATCDTVSGPPQKLDLTGGAFNRDASYTAANGVTVTSSAPTYSNSNYYYLAYLFNESYDTDPHHYWLTSSSGNQSLTFDFHQPYTFQYVRVYPTAISDRKSNYLLEAWDGSSWVDVSGGWVTTTSDPVGTYRDHSSPALTNVTKVRFTLSREASWGVTLTEVEFYYYP